MAGPGPMGKVLPVPEVGQRHPFSHLHVAPAPLPPQVVPLKNQTPGGAGHAFLCKEALREPHFPRIGFFGTREDYPRAQLEENEVTEHLIYVTATS